MWGAHSTSEQTQTKLRLRSEPKRTNYMKTRTKFGKEAGESRIWAGIHYPMDNVAGVQLGRSVAQVFISWAQNDGSQ